MKTIWLKLIFDLSSAKKFEMSLVIYSGAACKVLVSNNNFQIVIFLILISGKTWHLLENFDQKNCVFSARTPPSKLEYIGAKGAFRKI